MSSTLKLSTVAFLLIVLNILPQPSAIHNTECPQTKYGWKCDFKSSFSSRDGDHYFCDIDVMNLSDLTKERFIDEYLLKKPLLINCDISDWSQNITLFSKQNLLILFRNYKFEFGTSLDLVLKGGKANDLIKLRKYLNYIDSPQFEIDKNSSSGSLYIFDRKIWRKYKWFKKEYFNPPQSILSHTNNMNGILFIGGTETGATFHSHGETWVGLAFGRKRWLLYPPEIGPIGGYWPSFNTRQWLIHIYPHLKKELKYNKKYKFYYADNNYNTNQHRFINFIHSFDADGIKWSIQDIMNINNGLYKPLECIQSNGQILYLPEFWYHSVLNLGQVIAGGVQTPKYFIPYMQSSHKIGELHSILNKKSDLEKESIHCFMSDIYDGLSESAPFSATFKMMIGHELKQCGDIEKAKKYFIEAILMDPTFIQSYDKLANIYRIKGNKEMYEKILRIAYRINKHFHRINKKLIELFRSTNRHNLLRFVQNGEPLPL